MDYDGNSTLHTHNGVLAIVLDNPPVNLLTATMMRELRGLTQPAPRCSRQGNRLRER